jgi:hypothetical protein
MVHFTPEQEEIIKSNRIAEIVEKFRKTLPGDAEQCIADKGTYFKLMSLPSSNTNRCREKTREVPLPARRHRTSHPYHTCKLARQPTNQDSSAYD